MNNEIRIATIVTCFNRCEKTIKSLQSLIAAMNEYNGKSERQLYVELYLTDDGCTDNTVAEVMSKIAPVLTTTIIKGTGDLFWAGGMRAAWSKAMEKHWDYYLLYNDDTMMMSNAFEELFKAAQYCIDKYQRTGLYSGIICEPGSPNKITYGGSVWKNEAAATSQKLNATGYVQECDMTNANILLVHYNVVDKLGMFYMGFRHGKADYDYSINAKKNGFPVVVTANVCGECECDHSSAIELYTKVCKMTMEERKKFFAHPLHSSDDYIELIRRTAPSRLKYVKFGRWLSENYPRIYLFLFKLRAKL